MVSLFRLCVDLVAGCLKMLYIVLPAYNEEQTLPALLESIKGNMEKSALSYCVLVVNDGSFDGTVAVVKAAMESMPIKLIEHPENRGLAQTMNTGFRAAAKEAEQEDVIVTMDADNTHDPGLIATMLQMIKDGHDVVIGSRYQRGARVVGVPFLRKVLSFGARVIFSVLFPIKGVRDYTSGYRAFRSEVLKRMLYEYGDDFISEPGLSSTVDMLLKIRKYPVTIGEAPLTLRYDFKAGESKMKVARTVKETFKLIWKRLLS
jgi:dolichol-phosphate mannosyltransferase